MAVRAAVGGVGRSLRCAQPPRLGERPFSTVMLQRQLPDHGVEALEIRFVRLGCRAAKHVVGRANDESNALHFLASISMNKP